jgi:hypothetical protein
VTKKRVALEVVTAAVAIITALRIFGVIGWVGNTIRYSHPNPVITPGWVRTTDTDSVCRTPSPPRRVTKTMYDHVYAAYKITDRTGFVLDHLISREIGGADDEANLWPQPTEQAKVKDKLENKLHTLVCSGQLDIRLAQKREAANWVSAYNRYVGSIPR